MKRVYTANSMTWSKLVPPAPLVANQNFDFSNRKFLKIAICDLKHQKKIADEQALTNLTSVS